MDTQTIEPCNERMPSQDTPTSQDTDITEPEIINISVQTLDKSPSPPPTSKNLQGLGICTNCNQNDGKYRCPKCDSISCSLKCCNEHKIKQNCSGKRERVEFVPLSEMNGDSIRRDIRFLMTLKSKIGTSRRAMRHERNEKQNKTTHRRFQSLCQMARKKGVRLFLQPIGMTKHQTNQSFVTIKESESDTQSDPKMDEKNKMNEIEGDSERRISQKSKGAIHWTMSFQFGSRQLLVHDVEDTKTLISVLQNLKHQKMQYFRSTESIESAESTLNDAANSTISVDDIISEYGTYWNDTDLIQIPMFKKKWNQHKSSRKLSESECIAKDIVMNSVMPTFWSMVCPNEQAEESVIDLTEETVKEEVKDKDKLNIILKIPNHFMFIRINPQQTLAKMLRGKVINEYPEFIFVTPEEMKTGRFVIVDRLTGIQYKNTVQHNVKIHTKKVTLREQMERNLSEKKLFERRRNQNNGYRGGHRGSCTGYRGRGRGFGNSRGRGRGRGYQSFNEQQSSCSSPRGRGIRGYRGYRGGGRGRGDRHQPLSNSPRGRGSHFNQHQAFRGGGTYMSHMYRGGSNGHLVSNMNQRQHFDHRSNGSFPLQMEPKHLFRENFIQRNGTHKRAMNGQSMYHGQYRMNGHGPPPAKRGCYQNNGRTTARHLNGNTNSTNNAQSNTSDWYLYL